MEDNQLKKVVLKGVKWSSYSSLTVAAIQFISIILLGIFLEKNEMGQIAIIQTIVGITIIFLDMGISNAVVHLKNITEEQLSSVYWVNIVSGIFFTMAIYLSAPIIADFYKSNQLNLYIETVSLSFIILSISRLYKFLFIKKILLKEIAISEILSYALAFVSLIILLKLNYKVFAFIYSILVRSVIQSLYLFIKGIQIFKPTLRYNHKSLKQLFNYGLFNLGQNITVYFNSQLDTILIGRLLGMEVLGVYSIAKNLASKPLQLISPVISKITFPLMSKVQFDNDRLKEIYIKSVQYLFSIVLIIYVVMSIESSDLIQIIYQEKYNDSIKLLQLLTFLFIVNAIGNPIGSLILASGKVNLGFYWNVAMLFVIPIVIYFSSFYGIEQIIINLIVFQIISFIFSFKLITKRILQISFSEIFFPLLYIILSIIPAVIVTILLYSHIDNPYVRIFGLSILALLIYIFSIYKFYKTYFMEIKNNIAIK